MIAFKLIGGLFRLRKLLKIEQAAHDVLALAEEYDAEMNGTAPMYEDARSPDGDDYNELSVLLDDLRIAL